MCYQLEIYMYTNIFIIKIFSQIKYYTISVRLIESMFYAVICVDVT